MANTSNGVVGVRQSASTSESPVYDVPFGTVQLANASADGSGNFDLAAGFTAAAADFENQDEEDDEEGDDDDGDSDDGKGKKKGKRARSEAKGERDLKTGRRKIKIEFIEDDARRHITFSKRKAGIMKKAYELATLTGTQVLLLVVSQTGLVYTFTTPKLQALVTQAEGRNLIQACLNAPDPPNGASESGNDESGDDASDADDALSPSESQTSSNKRAAQNRKRPRTNSASKSSSASTSAAGASGAGDDDTASNPTAKRGRGRPRKVTAGGTASYADTGAAAGAAAGSAGSSAANSAGSGAADNTPMPPPAMHQSFSDDAVHQQHQQHQHQHQQHQQQYTHVGSSEFTGYGNAAFYGDTGSGNASLNLGYAQPGAHAGILAVDANGAAWNQNASPNPNAQMFDTQMQQQQQQASGAFNYAQQQQQQQHFGHFPHHIPPMQGGPAW
ncbi:hypothetical protein PaG_04862 [Moesziomyces aphidis]|uniref:MADS-box domain-containing protein n=1 Tax=Moesziomyces aphidis TaxID=84754 RepID=W3VJK7_MOEAP|nr:hypothetical protein PaG_04862 [Moesziomyces aphidis]